MFHFVYKLKHFTKTKTNSFSTTAGLQSAVDMTCAGEINAPPQKWVPAFWIDTCHGDCAVDVATWPPMMRDCGGAHCTVMKFVTTGNHSIIKDYSFSKKLLFIVLSYIFCFYPDSCMLSEYKKHTVELLKLVFNNIVFYTRKKKVKRPIKLKPYCKQQL